MEIVPLIRTDYSPPVEIYPVTTPPIVSGATYYFQSASGLSYQVTFGKKKNNYLGNIVNFSVLSDEFEDEYSETNKGETYHIVATMIEIFRIYHDNHPYSNSYEFSGEFKDERDSAINSIRTRLYHRIALRVVDLQHWNLEVSDNKVTVLRKHP
jgi:hypothetical protein